MIQSCLLYLQVNFCLLLDKTNTHVCTPTPTPTLPPPAHTQRKKEPGTDPSPQKGRNALALVFVLGSSPTPDVAFAFRHFSLTDWHSEGMWLEPYKTRFKQNIKSGCGLPEPFKSWFFSISKSENFCLGLITNCWPNHSLHHFLTLFPWCHSIRMLPPFLKVHRIILKYCSFFYNIEMCI